MFRFSLKTQIDSNQFQNTTAYHGTKSIFDSIRLSPGGESNIVYEVL